MRDSSETRRERQWLPRDQRIELKLDALLASVVGAQMRYRELVRERLPAYYSDSDEALPDA